jgi:CheY-like chemotaxis protein
MNPTEVCPLHQAKRFDLILLDLQMPVMDGFQVMEALKAMDPGRPLPVMALTAQPAHRPRALQSGAEDFVTKPFEVIELLGRIHRMIEGRLLDSERENSLRVPG